VRLKKYSTILGASLALILVTSCSQQSDIVTVPQVIEKKIPIVPRPSGVAIQEPYFYVVSDANLDAFIERYRSENGNINFIAVTPQGYENLAFTMAELRRYILQQKEIIVYYERSIAGTK